jgi:hypothetical protein
LACDALALADGVLAAADGVPVAVLALTLALGLDDAGGRLCGGALPAGTMAVLPGVPAVDPAGTRAPCPARNGIIA